MARLRASVPPSARDVGVRVTLCRRHADYTPDEEDCLVDANDEDDPSGVFRPEGGGASATRVVLAPVD